eukprot:6276272-Karenia_brevis.AAC.2
MISVCHPRRPQLPLVKQTICRPYCSFAGPHGSFAGLCKHARTHQVDSPKSYVNSRSSRHGHPGHPVTVILSRSSWSSRHSHPGHPVTVIPRAVHSVVNIL